jgi:hypothetical protein
MLVLSISSPRNPDRNNAKIDRFVSPARVELSGFDVLPNTERPKVFGDSWPCRLTWRRRGKLMSAAERYRRYAADCLRLAHAARAQADKAMLVEMADRWLRLAEQVERAETPTSEK